MALRTALLMGLLACTAGVSTMGALHARSHSPALRYTLAASSFQCVLAAKGDNSEEPLLFTDDLPAFNAVAHEEKLQQMPVVSAEAVSAATLSPTKAPTPPPTTAGQTIVTKQVEKTAVKATIKFPVTAKEMESKVMRKSLTDGVAISVGLNGDAVMIGKIGGQPIAALRRRLAESTEIEFIILSPSEDAAQADKLAANVQNAAESGSMVAAVQSQANKNGVLTEGLKTMPKSVAVTAEKSTATVTVVTIEVVEDKGTERPIDCEMSGWSVYGACSEKCGTDGTKKKTRSVVTQALNGGTVCPVTSESADCNRFACPTPQVAALLALRDSIFLSDCRHDCATQDVWKDLTADMDLKTMVGKLEGITIDGSGLVTEIELTGIRIDGGKLPDLSALTALKRLEFVGTGFTGPVPDFSKNVALEVLNLYGNKCTGKIPDFSKNTALEYLDISKNKCTGEIGDFSNNVNLVELYLSGNNLTGSIPDFSANVNLEFLRLDLNELEGSVPDFSSNTALKLLSLAQNGLTGTIPDFSKNTALTYLDIENNQCTGTEEWEENKSNYPSSCAVFV